MDTLSYKTKSANAQTTERQWFIVDATDMVVGRLATKIADVLRGKNKPSFTPHADTGDFVVVINCEKVIFTGRKMDDKEYITYSGYPGGQKRKTPRQVLAKHPERVIENAVKGMLPKNKLSNAIYKKLFVYAGEEHPHGAQKPQTLEIK